MHIVLSTETCGGYHSCCCENRSNDTLLVLTGELVSLERDCLFPAFFPGNVDAGNLAYSFFDESKPIGKCGHPLLGYICFTCDVVLAFVSEPATCESAFPD